MATKEKKKSNESSSISKTKKRSVKSIPHASGLTPKQFDAFPFVIGDGDIINPSNAEKIATVYACKAALCKTHAMLPYQVFKIDGATENKLTDHWLYKLMSIAPNRYINPYNFKYMMAAHVIMRGNFYAQKIKNALGQTIELVPLDPDRMQVVVLDNNELGYIYRTLSSQYHAFARDDIFHVIEDTEDGITGRSKIEVASTALGLASNLQRHTSSFFKNGTNVTGILKLDGSVDSEEHRKTLINQWKSLYSGPDKAGSIAVLEAGTEYQAISMTAKDAELTALTQMSIQMILSIMDVPPYRVQDFLRATFKNVEESSLNWSKNSIQPRVIAFEAAIQFDLLSELYGTGETDIIGRYNLDSIVRGSLKERYEANNIAIQGGWKTINEIRALSNDAPVIGGDVIRAPLNMGPLNADGSTGTPQPSGNGTQSLPGDATDQNRDVKNLLFDIEQSRINKNIETQRSLISSFVLSELDRAINREKKKVLQLVKRSNGQGVLVKDLESLIENQSEYLLHSLGAESNKDFDFKDSVSNLIFEYRKDLESFMHDSFGKQEKLDDLYLQFFKLEERKEKYLKLFREDFFNEC